ncbi:MAG: HNH endonuclease [Thiobacillaceae bacterium]|jgi:putative restriction endonuclease|nr:HNH endonuclease [Thiobacillaceae bacterium]MBP9916428.1 HNH endonuclease [Thiobacillaceae bacterium]
MTHMTDTIRKPWSRDELLLVMNLYCRIPFGRQHSRASEVIELANALGRTPGSVAMKLNNLTSLDPEERARGVKGLPGASQLDRLVWNQFHEDWERFAIESEQLRYQVTHCAQPVLATENMDESTDGPTESQRMAKTRLVQGFFRRMVLMAYQGKCCISGNPIPALLVASHILPWASHPEHRVNPCNGLCLSRLHDGAFDQGLITFDEDYRLVLSKRIRDHLAHRSIHDNFACFEGKPLNLPEKFYPDRQLLAKHRETLFKDA